MTDAIIATEVLSWAREKNELSQEGLAHNLGISVDKIESWESGEKFPTFRQAIDLAKALRIPFGYLFLTKPPIEELIISDFRTIRDRKVRVVSVELIDMIYELLRKQQWYREYLIDEGSKPLEFINKFTNDIDVDELSSYIRNTFDINVKEHTKAGSWDNYFRELINKLENKGVLVLRSGIVGNNTKRKLSLEEFRGFALCDEYSPIIFINCHDFKTSQIFTLIHELTHLLLGQSGISNPTIEYIFKKDDSAIEKFCNQIAADVLLPQEFFIQYWNNQIVNIENIQNIARLFRVSTFVVLIKAFENKLFPLGEYTQLKLQLQNKQIEKEEDKSAGESGNFYNAFRARNSNTLINVIIGSALEGKELYKEASDLLGIKVNTIESVAVHFGIR